MTQRYFDELRNARLARGTELKDVARETRISLRVLEAIEQGNLHILPQAYVRSFLRDYAEYLNLNTKEILAAYDAESKGRDAAVHQVATPSVPPANAVRSVPLQQEQAEPVARIAPMKAPRVKRVDTNMTAIIASGIVLITGFVLIYFFLSGDANKKEAQSVTTQAPPPPIVPQYTPSSPKEQTPEQPVTDTAHSVAPMNPADGMVLDIATKDSVWMSVMGDTAHLQRGVLQKGTHVSFRAKTKFLVTIGNTKLVSLTLNGKSLGVGDSTSRVLRNVVITPGTTSLVPSAPEPVPQRTIPPPVKKVIPLVKAPPTKGKAPPVTSQPKRAAVTTPPVKQRAAAAAPLKKGTVVKTPPAKAPVAPPKKKIKLREWPATIEKVPIKQP